MKKQTNKPAVVVVTTPDPVVENPTVDETPTQTPEDFAKQTFLQVLQAEATRISNAKKIASLRTETRQSLTDAGKNVITVMDSEISKSSLDDISVASGVKRGQLNRAVKTFAKYADDDEKPTQEKVDRVLLDIKDIKVNKPIRQKVKPLATKLAEARLEERAAIFKQLEGLGWTADQLENLKKSLN